MGQAKVPVKCDRCGEQGKRKALALKDGWNRRRYAKPSTQAPWACGPCLLLDAKEARAEERLREHPAREEKARKRTSPMLRTLAMMGAVGGLKR